MPDTYFQRLGARSGPMSRLTSTDEGLIHAERLSLPAFLTIAQNASVMADKDRHIQNIGNALADGRCWCPLGEDQR